MSAYIQEIKAFAFDFSKKIQFDGRFIGFEYI